MLSQIGNYDWEKGEQWQEKWYATQLCFSSFSNKNNQQLALFARGGLKSLAINDVWYYEKSSSQSWDSGKKKAAQNQKSLSAVVTQSEKLVNKAQTELKILTSFQTINPEKLRTFKNTFHALWSIFSLDLGKPLGLLLTKKLQRKKLSPQQIQIVKDYCYSFKEKLGPQMEEESLTQIKMMVEKYPHLKLKDQPDEIKNLLSKHTRKFQYLSGTNLDSKPFIDSDFFQKLKLTGQSQAKKFPKHIPKNITKLLSKEDIHFIELTKKHIFLDNITADINSKLDFKLNKLITEKFFISSRELSWYSFDELETLVTKARKLTQNQFSERKNYRVMIQVDGTVKNYYGKKAYLQAKTKAKVQAVNYKNIRELSGMTASIGNITGSVKIVRNVNDIHKVKQGDILVAQNTHPDLMLAIKRSAGIVTDYGGITSHAAIVSREFNIPCIVGTNIATQVLKDGDIIKLDASSGKIKILNKSKKLSL